MGATTAAKLIEKGRMEGEMKGRVEGRIEGLKEAIEIGLELKYGIEGLKLLEQINNISLVEKLEAIKEVACRLSPAATLWVAPRSDSVGR